MKRTSKKIVCVLLAVLMLMTSWAFSVSAEECEHVYSTVKETIVAPTCNSTGLLGYVCVKCGAFDKDNTERLPLADHDFVVVSTVPATCTKEGTVNYKCKVCNKTKTEKLAVKEHTYSAWKVAKEATCKENGAQIRVCSSCGYIQEKVIPAFHPAEYIQAVEATAPTCTEHGTTAWSFCKLCGEKVIVPERIAPLGHKMYKVADGSVPTCTKAGEGHIKCERCTQTIIDAKTGKEIQVGLNEFFEIPATGHHDESGDGFCDECEARICKCICHQENFLAKLVVTINEIMNKFFQKTVIEDGEEVTYYFACCTCQIPEGGKLMKGFSF